MTGFTEVAERVFVLRYPVLDVNVALVTGDGAALVVDTLATDAQAAELLTAIRRITDAPLVVVNTHHHFDHCFGNATLAAAGAPVWAHRSAVALLARHGEAERREWHHRWLSDQPRHAADLAATRIHPPEHPVAAEASLEVGGRRVVLRHFGRGHTAGDLVVHVPDAAVVVAGDLVEESGPPQFGDAYPIEWPETLAALLGLAPPGTVVVPGHGSPVDPAFVRAQHAELAALAWLIREGDAGGAPVATVAARAVEDGIALDRATAEVAVRRGYTELSSGS